MFYAITEQKIAKAKTLQGLNSTLGTKLEDEDFKIVGNDKIVILNKQDMSFLQDKKRLSQIAIEKLYKKDTNYLMYILLAIQILTLIRTGS